MSHRLAGHTLAAVGVLLVALAGVGCSLNRAPRAPPYPLAFTPADAKLLAKLRNTVLAHFHYTSVPDFSQKFSCATGTVVRFTPEVEHVAACCNCRCDGLHADETLTLVLRASEIAWVVRGGEVVICSREEAERDPFTAKSRALEALADARRRLTEVPREQPDPETVHLQEVLTTREIDLDFDEASIREIVDFVRDFFAVNIVFSEELVKSNAEDERMAIHLKGARLAQVLDTWGLVGKARNGALMLMSKREDEAERQRLSEEATRQRKLLSREFETNFSRVPFYQAAMDLGGEANLEVLIDEALWIGGSQVTLAGVMTLEESLNSLSLAAGAQWILEDGRICFVKE